MENFEWIIDSIGEDNKGNIVEFGFELTNEEVEELEEVREEFVRRVGQVIGSCRMEMLGCRMEILDSEIKGFKMLNIIKK